MTLDDYLSARMISYPFCLYDCDIPCDGATAIILSRRGAAPDTGKPPIAIEAAGSALYERHTWDQRDDLTTMAAHDAAAHMWEQTNLTAADVDFADPVRRFQLPGHAVDRGVRLLRARRGRPVP